MKYYSTKRQSRPVGLRDAVIDCIPPDGGLYMPESLPVIPRAFINNMADMSLQEIAYVTANMFLGDDVDSATLKDIVDGAMTYNAPLVKIAPKRYVLELFHGPTMAFKDFGVGFMSRLVQVFNRHDETKLNVLVATTGNTGSAVANGFSDADDVNVFILYPRLRGCKEAPVGFTATGKNIHTIEIGGSIDDCKSIVASAFADQSLRGKVLLTSANSVNFARLMPQIALFFYAEARLTAMGEDPLKTDFSLPSGNLSILTSGLLAKRAGLDCDRLIAACNANNTFDIFMRTGVLAKRTTVGTLARYMDMSMPSNLPRIMELCGGDIQKLRAEVSSATVPDNTIETVIRSTKDASGYIADPHTAVGLAALDFRRDANKSGIVFATADPQKSQSCIERICGLQPGKALKSENTSSRQGKTTKIAATYPAFRKYLLSNQ